MSYKIIALIGKSGAGKDKILQELIKQKNNSIHEIISCTTRPPREGEINGKNYNFLSNEEFAERILHDEFLEAAVFNEWCYGTCKRDLNKDKINIGVFNPEGIYYLLEHKDVDLKVYYIIASDKERLLRQLNREKNPDIEEIIRRYKTDKYDFMDLEFSYENLINETPSDFFDAVNRILKDNFN